MRKQDRIARDKDQNQSDQHVDSTPRPQEPDQIKGGASSPEPPKVQHPGGKLPIPD